MAKKGKMTEVERIYIEAKYKETSVESIAKSLDRTVKIVKGYVEVLQEQAQVPQPTPEPVNTAPEPLRANFIKHTVGGNKGVTILTQQASEIGDIRNTKKPEQKSFIHKMNKD